ncbi:MAG: hypothetical protein SCH68_12540, partial [Brevefilum sp.]|nr:hypothetical protein [Brevefilum sp.]
GIYINQLFIVIALFILGLTTNIYILGLGAVLAFICFPVSQTCTQVIWQQKTVPDIQGRVFAFRRVIAYSTIPLAYLVAGPLADRVFNPLLEENGRLADSVGKLIGVGPGRGIGFMYLLMGFMLMLMTIAAYAYSHLRNVEIELPDMIPDAAPESGIV